MTPRDRERACEEERRGEIQRKTEREREGESENSSVPLIAFATCQHRVRCVVLCLHARQNLLNMFLLSTTAVVHCADRIHGTVFSFLDLSVF